MADEPSDACSRTDGDGVRAGRNNKRKTCQACSYPKKRDRSARGNERERFEYFVAVASLLTYFLIEYDDGEESEEEDGELLIKVVDLFLKAKPCAEPKLGPGNAYIEKVIGMLQSIPGYDEAIIKATQDRKP